MIPKECKRLAEVDFPIALVSKYSAGENTGRLGHPHTLHKWWARRPLGACRAMLMALLLPDPCDPNCPGEFKSKARELLPRIQGKIGKENIDLRKKLLEFIGYYANWEFASDQKYLEVSRGLVKAAHPTETPLVVDPFAGGGSIPLEASRLGCESYASDLNPVANLVLKVLLEDIPRYGQDLVDELQVIGNLIKEKAEIELANYYPLDPDGSMPIAYLWARTVKCEAPNCGSYIPLVRSFWLSKKAKKKIALRFIGMKNRYPQFEIFVPNSDKEVPPNTIANAKAKCMNPNCEAVLTPDRVRSQLKSQRGGANPRFDDGGELCGGAILLAIVTTNNENAGRQYRLPTSCDYKIVNEAQQQLEKILKSWEIKNNNSECPIPNELISLNEIRRISVPLYGATTWGDLYTMRQNLLLYSYTQAIKNIDMSEACSRLCSLALDRLLIISSSHCRWKSSGESIVDMFGRHDIGMVWDFAESSPRIGKDNSFTIWLNKYCQVIQECMKAKLSVGQCIQHDATKQYLPDESAQIWFTDPPYYDSIPYAHLADCFYVWIKRSLNHNSISHMFSTALTPKDAECVVDRPHRLSSSTKDKNFFETKISDAALVGQKTLSKSGCGSIVFAHKTTEGWESLLTGIVDGGWHISASWPIATELHTRLNARDTASLATSVHLVCRPRSDDAGVGEWGEVLSELPTKVGDWMERLQDEGVRGADLVFACIGPALEIFSRYSRVETAEGEEVKLGAYLEKVWEVVGRSALEQVLGTDEARARNGAAGALEEDARLTALFLWTMQATGGPGDSAESSNGDDGDSDDDDEAPARGKAKGFSLIYDVVRRFAQPLGIDLTRWENRIIKTEKGVVRLLPIEERSQQLFGQDSVRTVADWVEEDPSHNIQPFLFPEMAMEPKKKAKRGRKQTTIEIDESGIQHKPEATTLDRIHAAMLLQSGGQANALRNLIKSEQQRGPDFLRLANALSALYPKECEEKRLLDAMLLAVPR